MIHRAIERYYNEDSRVTGIQERNQGKREREERRGR